MELTDLEKDVIENRETEPRFSSELIEETREGVYRCRKCGQELFDSSRKYDSDSGWPSFYDAIDGAVRFEKDTRHGVERTEVVCSSCGGHLGHVFDDGPEPTEKRYCINGVSLEFEEEENE